MRVLAVGAATVDIVNLVESYPKEDEEVRAVQQWIVRGGNAGNLLVTLSQLGHACDWAGVIADDRHARYIEEDFLRHAIGIQHAHVHRGGKTPVSYVSLSRRSGSRTIVHFRDLTEFAAEHFAKIALDGYDWVHFEGRNVPELATMMERLAEGCGPPCSLEVEKPRIGIEALFSRADLLFFGRSYVESRGFDSADLFLTSANLPTVPLAICAWGEKGAWGRTSDRQVFHCAAYQPERLIDTLGAGDVFNAAVIDARLRHLSPMDMIANGCRLAGLKCGIVGLTGVGELARGG